MLTELEKLISKEFLANLLKSLLQAIRGRHMDAAELYFL